MRDFYRKYKEEILAIIGIVIPVLLGVFSNLLSENSIFAHVADFWFYYVIAILLTYAIYQAMQKMSLPLTIYARGGDPSFTSTISLSHSIYWYLGMGAEEFMRDVDVEEYLIKRRNEGHPVRHARFLFLHPDSEYFLERLKDVNPNRDLQAVAQAKRSYIKTLHHSLASLPSDVLQGFEIRFYDERPIWLLQFFDTIHSQGQLVGVIISMEIPRVHSNLSNQYLCKSKNNSRLFDVYKLHFKTLWEKSLPATVPGEFPKLLQ